MGLAARDGLVPIAPPPMGATLALDERQLCARPEWEFPDAEVAFSAPVAVVALLRTAILAFAHPRDSLIGGLESLLLHVKAEWEGQPRHRDPIFARDGWRCAVPVCTARQQLHDHHLVFRSRGGGNERENRITLCAWHHLRGVHAGRVRAEGEAPDAITWEIGVRTDADRSSASPASGTRRDDRLHPNRRHADAHHVARTLHRPLRQQPILGLITSNPS